MEKSQNNTKAMIQTLFNKIKTAIDNRDEIAHFSCWFDMMADIGRHKQRIPIVAIDPQEIDSLNFALNDYDNMVISSMFNKGIFNIVDCQFGSKAEAENDVDDIVTTLTPPSIFENEVKATATTAKTETKTHGFQFSLVFRPNDRQMLDMILGNDFMNYINQNYDNMVNLAHQALVMPDIECKYTIWANTEQCQWPSKPVLISVEYHYLIIDAFNQVEKVPLQYCLWGEQYDESGSAEKDILVEWFNYTPYKRGKFIYGVDGILKTLCKFVIHKEFHKLKHFNLKFPNGIAMPMSMPSNTSTSAVSLIDLLFRCKKSFCNRIITHYSKIDNLLLDGGNLDLSLPLMEKIKQGFAYDLNLRKSLISLKGISVDIDEVPNSQITFKFESNNDSNVENEQSMTTEKVKPISSPSFSFTSTPISIDIFVQRTNIMPINN